MSQHSVWAAVYTADANSDPAAALRPASPGPIAETDFGSLRLATSRLEASAPERLQEELHSSPLHVAYTGTDPVATGQRTLVAQGAGLDGPTLAALLDELRPDHSERQATSFTAIFLSEI